MPSQYRNPNVPSDGMTIDGPRGPVDLVAVERVQVSWPTHLTQADKAWLDQSLTGDVEQAARVAEGLGCTVKAVLRRVERHRSRSA